MRVSIFLFVLAVSLAQHDALAAKPKPPSPPSPPSPPAGDACVGKGGEFPAMAYARGVYGKKGVYVRTQFFLANSLGNCEVLVWDTDDYDAQVGGPSFRFDAAIGSGVLVWTQTRDNGENTRTGRPVVKALDIEVAGEEVLPPAPARTLFKASSTPFGFADLALSRQSSRLAFSAEDTFGGARRLRILLCELPQCSDPLAAFEASQASDTAMIGGTWELDFGRGETDGNERIYFMYRRGSSWSGGDLVMIEESNGQWTSPATLVVNEAYDGDVSTTALRQPSVLSLPGVADKVVFTSQDGTLGASRVDVFDVGTNDLQRSLAVGVGYEPNWRVSLEGASTILLNEAHRSQTSSIIEIDYASGESSAVGSAMGFGVDSSY